MTRKEFENLKKGDIVRVTNNHRYQNFCGIVLGINPDSGYIALSFKSPAIPKELQTPKVDISYKIAKNVTDMFHEAMKAVKAANEKVMNDFPGIRITSWMSL